MKKKLRCILGIHKIREFVELHYFVDEDGCECWSWDDECRYCGKPMRGW